MKSLEQDKFIVSFPPTWNLAANASQIPRSEHGSCLTICTFHSEAACEIELKKRESSSACNMPPAWGKQDSCVSPVQGRDVPVR